VHLFRSKEVFFSEINGPHHEYKLNFKYFKYLQFSKKKTFQSEQSREIEIKDIFAFLNVC